MSMRRSKYLGGLFALALVLTGSGQAPAQTYRFSCVIRNVYSGKVLDLPLNGFELTDGQQIQQYTKNGGRNQVWDLYHAGWSYGIPTREKIQIRSALSGRALEFPRNSGSGTPLWQWGANDGEQQRWVFIKVADVVMPGYTSSTPAYLIKNVQTGMVLDVPGFSTGNVTIQAYRENRGTNQLWVLEAP
jgi:hypothetical protein